MMIGNMYLYRGKQIHASVCQYFQREDGGVGCLYGTVWYGYDGTLHRIVCRELPIRKTFKTAVKDLEKFATKRKLKEA